MLRPSIIAAIQPDTAIGEIVEDLNFETLENSFQRELAPIFKKEFNHQLVDIEREGIQHNNKISDVFLAADNQLQGLSMSQRKVLIYYLPFVAEIREDWHLATVCFSAILEVEITVHRLAATTQTAFVPLDQIQLHSNALIGGKKQVSNPCFKIVVDAIPERQIADFLEGNPIRNFLEKVLCPLFLPSNSIWEIELASIKKGIRSDKKGKRSELLGFNTILT